MYDVVETTDDDEVDRAQASRGYTRYHRTWEMRTCFGAGAKRPCYTATCAGSK